MLTRHVVVRAIAASAGMAVASQAEAATSLHSPAESLSHLVQTLGTSVSFVSTFGAGIACLYGAFKLYRALHNAHSPVSEGFRYIGTGVGLACVGNVIPLRLDEAPGVFQESVLARAAAQPSPSAPTPIAAPKPVPPAVASQSEAPVLSSSAKASLAQARLVRDAVGNLYGRDADDFRGLSTAALVRARLMPPEMLGSGYQLVPAAGTGIEVEPFADGRSYVINLAGLAVQDCTALAGSSFAPVSDQACYAGHLSWRIGVKASTP